MQLNSLSGQRPRAASVRKSRAPNQKNASSNAQKNSTACPRTHHRLPTVRFGSLVNFFHPSSFTFYVLRFIFRGARFLSDEHFYNRFAAAPRQHGDCAMVETLRQRHSSGRARFFCDWGCAGVVSVATTSRMDGRPPKMNEKKRKSWD